jgi:hypothetical protein
LRQAHNHRKTQPEAVKPSHLFLKDIEAVIVRVMSLEVHVPSSRLFNRYPLPQQLDPALDDLVLALLNWAWNERRDPDQVTLAILAFVRHYHGA